MPTLVAALTLSALLKMAHVDLPRWHLAFWFGLLVALALFGSMPRTQAVLNGRAAFWPRGSTLCCWSAPTTARTGHCTGSS